MAFLQIFNGQCTAVFVSHGGRQEAHPPSYINLSQVCWVKSVLPQKMVSLSLSNGSTWELTYLKHTDVMNVINLLQAMKLEPEES
ncbi:MAG: hypothetical protein ABJI96_14550 [Paracoccaceae bacterium]